VSIGPTGSRKGLETERRGGRCFSLSLSLSLSLSQVSTFKGLSQESRESRESREKQPQGAWPGDGLFDSGGGGKARCRRAGFRVLGGPALSPTLGRHSTYSERTQDKRERASSGARGEAGGWRLEAGGLERRRVAVVFTTSQVVEPKVLETLRRAGQQKWAVGR